MPVPGAEAAVAAEVYDLAFFEQYMPFTANYQQRNAALKWFRQEMENGANTDNPQIKSFSNTEVDPVAHINHLPGMDYTFDEEIMHSWRWFEMVAQLNTESMAYAVNGAEGRSGGLTGCYFAQRPNSYDHKKHRQLRKAGMPQKDKKLLVWDFVLVRADGTGLRLHPQWSNNEVETYAVEGHAEEVEPPAHGLGESDGPGTYRRFKDMGTQRKLRFDGAKRPGQ